MGVVGRGVNYVTLPLLQPLCVTLIPAVAAAFAGPCAQTAAAECRPTRLIDLALSCSKEMIRQVRRSGPKVPEWLTKTNNNLNLLKLYRCRFNNFLSGRETFDPDLRTLSERVDGSKSNAF